MPHKGLTYATKLATASATASVFMLLVALSSPNTPLWPFVVVNWLLFAATGIVMMRNANNGSGDPLVMRGITRRFMLALVAFAICGNLALYTSNSMISPNDLREKSPR